MKKLFALVLVGLMFCVGAIAEETNTFISVSDFEGQFNTACQLTGSGHNINSDNIQVTSGTIRDCFTITLVKDIVTLNVYIPHMESRLSPRTDINEIDLLFFSDGTTESVAHMVIAIGELALATGAISSTEEVNDFITNMGFLENVSDGATNTLTINGLNYTYSISSLFGFHFSITKA